MASRGLRLPSVNPMSPFGLALISYAFFLICIFVPPGSYKAVMNEGDLMFLDPLTFIFVSVCIGSFALGAFLFRLKSAPGVVGKEKSYGRYYIIFPLLVGILLNCLSVFMFIQGNPNFLRGWFEDAHAAKRDLDVSGGLTEALPLLYAFCCWGVWRLLERESITGRPDYIVRTIVFLGIIVATFTAVAKVARYDLMPGLAGIFVTYFVYKSKNKKAPFFKYVYSLLKFFLIIIAFFLLFSWLRGGDEKSALFQDLMGYTGASYNRLAALLDGRIDFPHGGSGTYAFRFLSHIPLLQRWVDLSSIFNIPDSADVWSSEFGAVHRSGLDGRYIWVSAFGYVYSDIGMLVFPYFFILGIVAKYSWYKIVSGKVFGIFIYPWMAFSVLFWFGSNYFVYSRLLTLLGGALFIFIYDFFLSGRVRFGK